MDIAPRPLPEITVEATVKNGTVGGPAAVITLRRTGDLSAPLTVFYKFKGSGRRGIDYPALPVKKTFKAGKAERVIRIKPRGDLGGLAKRVVRVALVPGEGYTVGTASAAKVKLFSQQD